MAIHHQPNKQLIGFRPVNERALILCTASRSTVGTNRDAGLGSSDALRRWSNRLQHPDERSDHVDVVLVCHGEFDRLEVRVVGRSVTVPRRCPSSTTYSLVYAITVYESPVSGSSTFAVLGENSLALAGSGSDPPEHAVRAVGNCRFHRPAGDLGYEHVRGQLPVDLRPAFRLDVLTFKRSRSSGRFETISEPSSASCRGRRATNGQSRARPCTARRDSSSTMGSWCYPRMMSPMRCSTSG